MKYCRRGKENYYFKKKIGTLTRQKYISPLKYAAKQIIPTAVKGEVVSGLIKHSAMKAYGEVDD
jgi:hypothetical protein